MDASLTNHKAKSLKRFQCPEIDEATGEPCTVTSDRRFNIERHCSTMHRKSKASPIPSMGSSRQYSQSSGNAPLAQMQSSLALRANPKQGEEQGPASAATSIPSEAITRQLHPDPIPEALSDTSPTAQQIHTMPADIKKRKFSFVGYDRISEARRRLSVPSYPIKRSKKNPRQQRGLKWLDADGKDKFDNDLKSRLAQWGVKETHKSTCVLCPEVWSAADPTRLMDLFSAEKCPTTGSGRLTYHYKDHATSYARARAWFLEKH